MTPFEIWQDEIRQEIETMFQEKGLEINFLKIYLTIGYLDVTIKVGRYTIGMLVYGRESLSDNKCSLNVDSVKGGTKFCKLRNALKICLDDRR